jgi:protein phosphatase
VSDRDRVDQYWQTEILPVLEGKVDLATACQRTINMANTHNGHDNATVALVHCQVKQPVEAGQSTVLQDFPASPTSFVQSDTLLLSSPESSNENSGQRSLADTDKSAPTGKKPLVVGAIGLALLAAILTGVGLVSKQNSPSTPPAEPPTPVIVPSDATPPPASQP